MKGRAKATRSTRNSAKKTKRRRDEDTQLPKEPRTFVIARGVKNSAVQRLKNDLRSVFLPNTAKNVKVERSLADWRVKGVQERKFNRTRDFLEVCGPLGISHIMALFETDASLNLKLVKTPQGPTLSYKVMSYSLMADVQNASGNVCDVHHGLRMSPLVVMTNFQKTQHHELMVTMIQNLFPAVNPHSTAIRQRRRVVLFNYEAEKDLIQIRHYRIAIPETGLNKGLKTLLGENRVPDLGDTTDMSELLLKAGYASESEGDELAESRVQLPEPLLKRGESTKRRVKLTELGPRLDLVLHKIEQGPMDGLVLYNKYVEKTMEQVAETGRRREATAQLRAMRRTEQEKRVEAKRKEKEEKKRKLQREVPREVASDDDDVQYYRQQVGVEPDAHFGVQMESAKKKPKKRRGD